MNIKERKCESWSDFKTKIIEDLYEDGVFSKGRYLFRGQGS